MFDLESKHIDNGCHCINKLNLLKMMKFLATVFYDL